MDKILRKFDSHQDAARQDDDQLTMNQRFDALMKLMSPYFGIELRAWLTELKNDQSK